MSKAERDALRQRDGDRQDGRGTQATAGQGRWVHAHHRQEGKVMAEIDTTCHCVLCPRCENGVMLNAAREGVAKCAHCHGTGCEFICTNCQGGQ